MVTGEEGIRMYKNFADVICVCSLTRKAQIQFTALARVAPTDLASAEKSSPFIIQGTGPNPIEKPAMKIMSEA